MKSGPAEGDERRHEPDVETPLVSVIMAAFNAGAYIEQTCRSVLNQTYRHLELVVVDDGSSDDTADIVASLAATDSRVRLFRQTNCGVATARNAAIARAAGDFVAPIDADDLWLPQKIDRQLRALKQESAAGFAYCWWAWIDAAGRLLDRSPRWTVEGHVFPKLLDVNFTGNASVPLFRRDALLAAGGYEAGFQAQGCQGCEDWNLVLRVARDHPVTVVPAVLVGYRRHVGGMSRDCSLMWRSYQAMRKSLGDVATSNASPPSGGQFPLHLAGVAFWAGDYLGAVRWTLRARPVSFAIAVLPHIATLFARRIAGRLSQERRVFTEQNAEHGRLPEPLIPYDRLYARYWRRRSGG